jgi:hypothetical protein
MDAGKGFQLKTDILHVTHFIVSAWQQVTQSTIQNSFVKCDHMKKNQEGSDVTKVDGSGEDDITQDEGWVGLGASTPCVDFGVMCLWTRSLQHLVCCEWKKCVVWCGVVWCEVEVVWRRDKVIVAMTMRPSLNQCRV